MKSDSNEWSQNTNGVHERLATQWTSWKSSISLSVQTSRSCWVPSLHLCLLDAASTVVAAEFQERELDDSKFAVHRKTCKAWVVLRKEETLDIVAFFNVEDDSCYSHLKPDAGCEKRWRFWTIDWSDGKPMRAAGVEICF